ncbi:uncharacterized protein [Venturia canescens]|uniref:uncharacterized protein n=1 Tax=Venturia canescens TaxID=32260 RepID=UPI001C9BF84C|nr:uncharacterized protein LOC122414471 [Venturia canescens]
MLKLAIVLAATAFVASAKSASIETSEQLCNTMMNTAAEVIANQLDTVSKLYSVVNSLNGTNNSEKIEQFKQKMATRFEWIQRLAKNEVDSYPKGRYNKRRCMRYLKDFETKERDVKSNGDAIVNRALSGEVEKLEKIMKSINSAVEKVLVLKFSNNTCSGSNWENILEDIHSDVCKQTANLPDENITPSDLLDSILLVEYHRFYHRGTSVVSRTHKCVYHS